MEIGRRVTPAASAEMVKTFLSDPSRVEIDTATMYADGKTEKILGADAQWRDHGGRIATKINPWGPSLGGSLQTWHGESFSRENVRKQTKAALARLQTDKVDILYLHAPDHVTPIEETLEELAKLKQEGKFNELGLSNYSSWFTAEVVNVARKNGFPCPTVYQGMYSPLTRMIELELLPCLRYYGIRFYAYSPLAGGLLTGKHQMTHDENVNRIPKGRFNGISFDSVYRDRYFKQDYFEGISKITESLAQAYPENTPSLAQATFNWLFHHSSLTEDDGIVLGASSIRQLKENLTLCQTEPLKGAVVEEFERTWKNTSHLCPVYLR